MQVLLFYTPMAERSYVFKNIILTLVTVYWTNSGLWTQVGQLASSLRVVKDRRIGLSLNGLTKTSLTQEQLATMICYITEEMRELDCFEEETQRRHI